MPDFRLGILELYHIFGLLNLFLLYLLILAYADSKSKLWYGVFILSVVLDLFNYLGLFSLFNYSVNFTLAYLPWSVFTPIALYKYVLVSKGIKTTTHRIVFRFSLALFTLIFSYFFIKSYWVLLGDLNLRDQYFLTKYSLPLSEYWLTKGFLILWNFAGLILTHALLKHQSMRINKEAYYPFFLLVGILLLNIIKFVRDWQLGADPIISTPNELYLTLISFGALIIAYRKIIGINLNIGNTKQLSYNNKAYQLDEERLLDLEKKLLLAMSEQELYKKQKLQLRDLSEAVSSPENHVSEVLSRKLQTSYYDFVNEYRVKEVIRLMNLPVYRDYKILVLAQESGFNAKTTFNSAFKKVTGQTPSEYKKSHFTDI
ncbi:MAG: AraC family transcriptional regulator [Cyclobacteriaceae bacterium]